MRRGTSRAATRSFSKRPGHKVPSLEPRRRPSRKPRSAQPCRPVPFAESPCRPCRTTRRPSASRANPPGAAASDFPSHRCGCCPAHHGRRHSDNFSCRPPGTSACRRPWRSGCPEATARPSPNRNPGIGPAAWPSVRSRLPRRPGSPCLGHPGRITLPPSRSETPLIVPAPPPTRHAPR